MRLVLTEVVASSENGEPIGWLLFRHRTFSCFLFCTTVAQSVGGPLRMLLTHSGRNLFSPRNSAKRPAGSTWTDVGDGRNGCSPFCGEYALYQCFPTARDEHGDLIPALAKVSLRLAPALSVGLHFRNPIVVLRLWDGRET